MAKTRRQLSESERAERRRQDRERSAVSRPDVPIAEGAITARGHGAGSAPQRPISALARHKLD